MDVYKDVADLQALARAELPKISGWCSPAKADKLISTVLEHRVKVAVEIGVFAGSSLLMIAMALKHQGDGVVYGIDPWTHTAALEEMQEHANRDWWQKVDLENIYQECLRHIRQLDLAFHCQLCRERSDEALHRFADVSIDLLHIDGNHSELRSFADAQLYLPKVKPGGIIFFDDLHWTEAGRVTTSRAVEYLRSTCRQLNVVSDCAILQKVT